MQCAITIKGFYQDAIKQPDGKTRFVDVVEYFPTQDAGLTMIKRRVDEILEIEDDPDPTNLGAMQARNRRNVIQIAYNNWKQGNAPVASGWPIAEWQGVTKSEADILRFSGYASVEDLASMPDHKADLIPMPNARDVKERAIRFLSSASAEKAAASMKAKDDQIARMSSEMDEMREALNSLIQRAAAEEERRANKNGTPKPAQASAAA